MSLSVVDDNIKFDRLVMDLRRAGIDMAEPVALGALNLIWNYADRHLKPAMSAADIEDVARWTGPQGALAEALINRDWLDPLPDGRLFIHDYFDHRPDFIIKRFMRKLGMTFSDVKAISARKWIEVESQNSGQNSDIDASSDISARKPKPPKSFPRGNENAESVSARKRKRQNGRLEKEMEKEKNINTPRARVCARVEPPQPPPADFDALADTEPPPSVDLAGLHPDGEPGPEPERSTPEAAPDALATLLPRAVKATAARSPNAYDVRTTIRRLSGSTWTAGMDGWWQAVLPDLVTEADFLDELRRVEDASDPATRQAKDLGEFQEPGRYLVKAATKALKAQGRRWPTFPEAGASGRAISQPTEQRKRVSI